METSIMTDSHVESNSNEKKSKIIWAGPVLDAKCIIAIDSKFDATAEWNTVYFIMTAYDEYEYNGELEVKMTHPAWLECMIERIKDMYLESLVEDKKENHDTLH